MSVVLITNSAIILPCAVSVASANMVSLPKSLTFLAAGVAVVSIPTYYQLHKDLYRTQRLVAVSVNRLQKTVVAQTQDMQKNVLELETQLAKQNGRQFKSSGTGVQCISACTCQLQHDSLLIHSEGIPRLEERDVDDEYPRKAVPGLENSEIWCPWALPHVYI